MKMKSDVVMSSKRGVKLIDVEISINYTFLAYVFNRSKNKNTLFIVLLKSDTVFADCLNSAF